MKPQRIAPSIWHTISGAHVYCWFERGFESASRIVTRFLTLPNHENNMMLLDDVRWSRSDRWRKRCE